MTKIYISLNNRQQQTIFPKKNNFQATDASYHCRRMELFHENDSHSSRKERIAKVIERKQKNIVREYKTRKYRSIEEYIL